MARLDVYVSKEAKLTADHAAVDSGKTRGEIVEELLWEKYGERYAKKPAP